MVRIFKLKSINIYSDSNNHYIVHNTNKPFESGHTHIKNFNTAKYLAYLVTYNKIPKKGQLSNYLIDSLIRLTSSQPYLTKLNTIKKIEINKKEQRHE